MDIFKYINKTAKAERSPRPKTYKPVDHIKQNSKQDASYMLGADTIRGCKNNCIACYANKLCAIAGVDHNKPVKCKLTGKISTGKMLRIGVVGDPATDWAHTCREIKNVLKRSECDPDRVIYVTKLQKLSGLDLKVVKNMQISVDPLNPTHMEKTLQNIAKIRFMPGGDQVNMILRIRSYKSKNLDLAKMLGLAVECANTLKLPVLETRMRMPRKICNALSFDLANYKRHGSSLKPQSGFLEGMVKHGYFLCDKNNKGCKSCGNCLSTARVKSTT